MKTKKIVWTLKASASLDEYCAFIKKHSPPAAKKVKAEIIQAVKALATNPEMYQLDELRGHSSKNVRRFFRWNYKIVYEVFETEVAVLNIYHTSQDLSSLPDE